MPRITGTRALVTCALLLVAALVGAMLSVAPSSQAAQVLGGGHAAHASTKHATKHPQKHPKHAKRPTKKVVTKKPAPKKVVTKKAAPTKPAPTKPVTATARPARTWGITQENLPNDTTGLTALQQSTGQRPGVVMWYIAWSLRTGFPTADADRIRGIGATPEITWEPWNPADGVNQPAYANARVSAGDYDAYLTSWARSVAGWGHPLRLRLAQEMNGTWYPWADGQNGNAAGSFAQAWRHVVSVFRANHATNVTWVWSPNVPFPGTAPLAQVFPGDSYVDEVALDGYNWGGVQAGAQWTSFADVFGEGMAQLARLSTRPVSIGEVGCPQAGGDKAAWTAAMWKTLASWPQVRGVMFFSFDKEADWRVDSSAAAGTAFADGVAGYLRG